MEMWANTLFPRNALPWLFSQLATDLSIVNILFQNRQPASEQMSFHRTTAPIASRLSPDLWAAPALVWS